MTADPCRLGVTAALHSGRQNQWLTIATLHRFRDPLRDRAGQPKERLVEDRRVSQCDNWAQEGVLSKGRWVFSGPAWEPLWVSPGIREAGASGCCGWRLGLR
jgi:hypothetical protein